MLPPDDQVIFLAAMAARATHLLTGDRTQSSGRTTCLLTVLSLLGYLDIS